MAYYLQQTGQNLLISKEIQNVFQTDRFEIINLSNQNSQQRVFTNIIDDFIFQVDDNESCLYELRILLFNKFIPLERIYFNLEDLDKDVQSLPTIKKRTMPEARIMKMQDKITELQNEFKNIVKEKMNNVLK